MVVEAIRARWSVEIWCRHIRPHCSSILVHSILFFSYNLLDSPVHSKFLFWILQRKLRSAWCVSGFIEGCNIRSCSFSKLGIVRSLEYIDVRLNSAICWRRQRCLRISGTLLLFQVAHSLRVSVLEIDSRYYALYNIPNMYLPLVQGSDQNCKSRSHAWCNLWLPCVHMANRLEFLKLYSAQPFSI